VLTGAEAAWATLVQEGVRYVFGVPGTSELPLLQSLDSYPSITYLLALHESVAVGMADGYSRATGESLAIANVHATQGTLNGLGFLRAAYRDGIPLVVVGGAPGTGSALHEPNHFLQGLVDLTGRVTKWTWQVARAVEIPAVIHRGVTLARSAPQGPVYMALPQNCLVESVDVNPPLSMWRSVRFANQPAPEVIAEVLNAVLAAERPVLYAGNGISRANAVAELVEFAERLELPVVAEATNRGPTIHGVNFPASHPLWLGFLTHNNQRINEVLAQADLVLLIGVKTAYERVVGPWVRTARIIQIDAHGWEMGKNHPVQIGVVAEIRNTLAALVSHLKSRPIHARGHQRLSPTPPESRWAPPPAWSAQERGALPPRTVAAILNKVLPKDTVIVDDSQSFGHYLKTEYQFTVPDTLYGSLSSHLGWGLPAALGVQLARPDQRVLCIVSDGSFLMGPQGLWTAARYHIPLTVLVLNNRGFMSLRYELGTLGENAPYATAFRTTCLADPEIDIAALGRTFGVEAIRVEYADQLENALDEMGRNRRPLLLEILTSREAHDWEGSWFVPTPETL
jgi:benzoylformate decarboxylase